jgi:hypothetical protein
VTTTAASDEAVRCEVKLADSITLAMTMKDWEALTPAQRIKIVAEHIEAKIKDCGGFENYLDHALNRITPFREKL